MVRPLPRRTTPQHPLARALGGRPVAHPRPGWRGAGRRGSVAAMTLELHAYGDPVAIVVPPPGDVTPLADALDRLGGALAPDGDGG
jgi:hypothetical protein